MPQLMALEEIAGQVAHLQHEPQVALLRAHAGVGPLDDFHHAQGFLLGLQGGQHQEEVGGVAGLSSPVSDPTCQCGGIRPPSPVLRVRYSRRLWCRWAFSSSPSLVMP